MKREENKELITAIQEIEKEKGISKEYLLESLETALAIAYKKNFDSAENVKIDINDKTGEMHVYAQKEIVKEVKNPFSEIDEKTAKKENKKLKVGDVLNEELFPKDFGRIAAQTAKQIMLQKIREIERDMLFTEYSDRRNEIVSGIIQKIDANMIVIDLGKLEGVMPLKEQVPTERYVAGEKIKAYVSRVEKGLKGSPQVTLSRSHPDFLRKLFEFEIPEIYEGLIEIKAISRDPGKRSKIAVYSTNQDIDPVGSCVGQKGIRIQNIINELNGEKIDVIEWDEDPATFIASALLPAQVLAVDIKEEERFARVIVADDQLSLAIGKAGQNARLAVKLTNWKIDIKSETQFKQFLEYDEQNQEQSEESETEEGVEENQE